VFAHGYGLSVLEWTVIWSKLCTMGYRLISFDARGHGKSDIGSDGVGSTQMAADLKAVLEHFDVRDGVLIGHSMGGFVSIRFLLDHPKVAAARLKHCILLSTFAGDVYRGAPQTRLQIPLITSGILTRLTRTQTYGWAFGISLEGDRPAPSSVELLRRSFAATHHISVLPILRAFANENYYDCLGEIVLPCTVVYGLSDKTTPAYHSETLHARIRDSQIVRIPHVGHLTNWEAPERVTGVILAAAQNKRMPAVSPTPDEESARAMPVPLAQANANAAGPSVMPL
jgi:non-heme chloroperoxidase